MAPTRILLALATIALAGPVAADPATPPARAPRSGAPSASGFSFDRIADPKAIEGKAADAPQKPRAGWNGFYGGLNAGGAMGAPSDP